MRTRGSASRLSFPAGSEVLRYSSSAVAIRSSIPRDFFEVTGQHVAEWPGQTEVFVDGVLEDGRGFA